jgi:hemerythrin-like domain-containing protein
MDNDRQTGQLLGREHRATLALLGRVEQALLSNATGDAAHDVEAVRLLRALGEHLAQELERHFAFEERELFPRMSAAGEGDLAELLAEEHVSIAKVVAELAPLIGAATRSTLGGEGWNHLRRLTLELVERLVAHIRKEDGALLPLLDDLLDDEADRDLALAYATS